MFKVVGDMGFRRGRGRFPRGPRGIGFGGRVVVVVAAAVIGFFSGKGQAGKVGSVRFGRPCFLLLHWWWWTAEGDVAAGYVKSEVVCQVDLKNERREWRKWLIL